MGAVAPHSPAPGRNAFAAVYACRSQVDGLDDEPTWRLFLGQITGKTSLREMSPDELRQVVDKLQEAGAKRLVPHSGKGADTRPQAGKLRRLWLSLWELGEVRDRSDSALASFVMQQTGITALRWNHTKDLNLAIEALKSWCQRVGYRPKPATEVPVRSAMYGRWEPELIAAQWKQLVHLRATDNPGASIHDWLQGQFGTRTGRFGLTVPQAEEAIKRLGKWLRQVKRGRPELEEGPDA